MILINGRTDATLSPQDRGLHYGDGLFETVRIRDGAPSAFWPYHVARLRDGCARLRIESVDFDVLEHEATACCRGVDDGVLKIIVTRGVGGRGYRIPDSADATRILITYPAPVCPESWATAGVALRVCDTRLGCNPALAGLKHLNRLEQVLARSEWTDAAIADGLMRNAAGDVIEGTMTNLFFVSDGRLKTPDLSQCGVAGVMRARILDAAIRDGIAWEIGRYGLDDLARAEEMFVCNSVVGIWPVSQLAQWHYCVGPVTARMARLCTF